MWKLSRHFSSKSTWNIFINVREVWWHVSVGCDVYQYRHSCYWAASPRSWSSCRNIFAPGFEALGKKAPKASRLGRRRSGCSRSTANQLDSGYVILSHQYIFKVLATSTSCIFFVHSLGQDLFQLRRRCGWSSSCVQCHLSTSLHSILILPSFTNRPKQWQDVSPSDPVGKQELFIGLLLFSRTHRSNEQATPSQGHAMPTLLLGQVCSLFCC